MNELLDRTFKIWAYTVSHSFLILRSPLKYPDQVIFSESEKFNIDIEFSAVAYLDIPSILPGVIIHQIENSIPKKLRHYRNKPGYKIFEITSENNQYYIVAGSYRVGKSRWLSEDRIQNMNLEYDEIIATSQHVD